MTDPGAAADTALIVRQQIAAPPNTVFDFLVDPSKMVRWIGAAVDLDPVEGGVLRIEIGDGGIASGEYLEVDRPNRVVFTWGWQGMTDLPPGSSTVTITLIAQADGTTVELQHDGLSRALRTEHGKGWTHFLGRLTVLAGGGDPGPNQLPSS
jgi:uncharacterized protein YndB with AHSA1/START domain